MKLFILITLTTILLGCGGVYTGEYLDYKHAHKMFSCPADDIEDPRHQSFLAIQTALAVTDWVIEKKQSDKKHVTVRKCLSDAGLEGDPLTLPDSICTTIRFMVMKNATIFAVVPKEKPMQKSMVTKTQNWILDVERNFAEFRCYSETLLQKQVSGKIETKQ